MQEAEFWKQIAEENKDLRDKLDKLYQLHNEGEEDERRSSFLKELRREKSDLVKKIEFYRQEFVYLFDRLKLANKREENESYMNECRQDATVLFLDALQKEQYKEITQMREFENLCYSYTYPWPG